MDSNQASQETPRPPAAPPNEGEGEGEDLKALVVRTVQLFLPVLKISLPVFIGLQVARTMGDEYFTYAMDFVSKTGREDLTLLVTLVTFNMIFNLAWTTLWVMTVTEGAVAVSEGRPTKSLGQLLAAHWNQLLIEQIRALAAILFRLPLLIVPALVAYIRLAFVPLTVLLDPAYARGEVEALRESRNMAKGRFLLLTFWSLASLLIPYLFDSIFGDSQSQFAWENPLGALLSAGVGLSVNLASLLFLFALYRQISVRKSPC